MRRKISFGVLLPDYCGGQVGENFTSLSKLKEFCRAVEKLGFTSIWHREHFTASDTTPSSYEPMTTISAVSQMVEKPRLGIITILTLRHPIIFAKETATLDVLSGGRVMLCCVVGHREHEFEALGVSMRRRGQKFVESIEIIRRLWMENDVSWDGEFYKFSHASISPKPLQKPHPPLLIGSGGRSIDNIQRFERLLMRAAELGDGWYAAINMTPEAVGKAVEIIKTHLKKLGKNEDNYTFTAHKYVLIVDNESDARRTVSSILNVSLEEARKQQLIGTREEIVNRLEKFTATGITHFNLAPLSFDTTTLEFFADEVVPRYI
ncbi:MAG: LLM class flavin-dependent oxidoreductase [Candidatus Caldarchaeum sp.]